MSIKSLKTFTKVITPKIIYLILLIILLFIIIKIIKYFQNKKIENFEVTSKYENGLNNTDKILFINLENRKDRLKLITSELKKQGVDDNKIQRINAHYTPGNGHLGCSKSHYDSIQYAIDNNLDNVIIFEDDFIFSTSPEETKSLLNNLFNKLNTNEWDVVLFAYSWANISDTKYPFLHKITDAQTASGYIVNKHYFKTLQNIYKKSIDNMSQEKTTKVDFEPFALDQLWKENQKKDNWFCFNPQLGKQNEKSVSTIQSITNYNSK
jgi:GR25 family glycosyltransferase involved in LPS biosynthesis